MDTEQKASSTSSSMMALRAHRRGGPERLVYEEVPRPVPGRDEVCVAVRAAGITFAELTWPETWESGGVDRTPVIPSHEFSGVVSAAGPGVTDFGPGDPVFGIVPFDRDGAAAEFVVVPIANIARKDKAVSDLAAAAAVLPALTALEALRDQAHLTAGQRLLIRGGTGAVGAFLTQFARAIGADITVTTRSQTADSRARELGAGHVVLADPTPETRDLHGFDIAIDAVGGDVPEWMYSAVRPGGQLVVLQEPPDQEWAAQYGIQATFFVVSVRRERLDELAENLAAHQVEVAVADTFPLSQGRAAYGSGSSPKSAPGKTVIVVS